MSNIWSVRLADGNLPTGGNAVIDGEAGFVLRLTQIDVTGQGTGAACSANINGSIFWAADVHPLADGDFGYAGYSGAVVINAGDVVTLHFAGATGFQASGYRLTV